MDISLVSLAYVALDKQSCIPGVCMILLQWEEDYLDAARVSTKISKLLDIRHLMDYIRFYLNRKRGRVC